MFFYSEPFVGLVFRAVWVLPVFLLMLALSLLTSLAVRAVCSPLVKRLPKQS